MNSFVRHTLRFFFLAAVLLTLACSAPRITVTNAELASPEVSFGNLLLESAGKGNTITVMRLVEEGLVDVNVRDGYGWNACMYAAQGGHLGLLEYLITRKAALNVQDEYGYTPLIIAVNRRNTEMVAFLLSRGADAAIRDINGYTPLMWALYQSYWDGIDLLIRERRAINLQNFEGQTVLHMAVVRRFDDYVPLFIKNGADVNVKDYSGNTPLLLAVDVSSGEVVKALLSAGADAYRRDEEGRTPLIRAAYRKRSDVIPLLPVKKVLDAQDAAGMTALMVAAEKGMDSTVAYLIAQGANRAVRNGSGETALTLAMKNGHTRIVKLLGGAS